MSTLSITSSWANAATLNESDLDNIKVGTETFLNTTKMGADNINTGVITGIQLLGGAITRAKLEAVGQQVSSSTSTFTTTSTTYTDITNATVTITTIGRPVFIVLQADDTTSEGSIGGACTAATKIAEVKLNLVRSFELEYTAKDSAGGINSFDFGGSQCFHIDEVAAGTYTYKMEMKTVASDCTGSATNLKLLAYEM